MGRIKPQALLLQSKRKKAPTRISITTIIACNLVVVLIVLSLFITYRQWTQRHQPETGLQNSELLQDNDAVSDLKKFDLPRYAILNTSKGFVVVELHKEASPEIVDKFLDLCQKEYFKGMPFHRVIKNFVIQGGNALEQPGAAGDWIMKGKPHGKHAASLKHEAFMLGTSKSKGDGKEFDLIITTAPIPDLSDKVNVFGRVIKGHDIVQEIEEVDTDEHYRPKSNTGIINITLKQEI